MTPPAEPPRQAQKVRLVEGVIRAHQLAPPSAKAAAGVATAEIAVDDNPIHTIIAPFNQILIVRGEVIVLFHPRSLPERRLLGKRVGTEALRASGQAERGAGPPPSPAAASGGGLGAEPPSA